jgi:alkanesulfonate monooxygenase SsuD/methylene tetrahydromethanopterin reductase-like flavin-dependent oxidoreductase (luciferase family)
MAERLGLAVIPGIGWRASEIQAIAREAEAAGFDAIFAAEVNNDVMATVQLMGAATRRIQVGTWIANIYVRHSYACAQGAALIADATEGRFVLGLGVSHPPVNKALGIDMGDAPNALRRYVTAVRSWRRCRPADSRRSDRRRWRARRDQGVPPLAEREVEGRAGSPARLREWRTPRRTAPLYRIEECAESSW